MARLELDGTEEGELLFTVTVSRRNLLALLHKLDDPESAHTIANRYVYLGSVLQDRMLLVLRAEADDPHYIGREEPGRMSDDTETFIDGQT